MKASAWLIIELRRENNYDKPQPHIVGVRKTRPLNQLAVRVTLDIDVDSLQPQVEAMVDAGLVHLEIEEPEPEYAEGEDPSGLYIGW